MDRDVQYITNEAGERVGVLLTLDTYQQLAGAAPDPDLLPALNQDELLALAQTTLSLEAQSQLDDLLNRNVEGQLPSADIETLDHLLTRIDHLNILKARARYTLNYLSQMDARAS